MDGLLGLAGMMTLHIITIVMKFGSFPKIPFSFFRTSKSFPSILRLFFRGVWLPIVLPEPGFFPDVPSASQGEPPTGWHHLTPGAGGSPLPGGWGPWVSP